MCFIWKLRYFWLSKVFCGIIYLSIKFINFYVKIFKITQKERKGINLKKNNKTTTIMNFIPRFFNAMRSKDTPGSAKLIGLLAVAYAVIPADLIADVVPVLGILDDAIVLPFLMYLATTMLSEESIDSNKSKVNKDQYIKVDDFEVK